MAAAPLICPSCGTAHPPEERFCPSCGLPLVVAGSGEIAEPLDDHHDRQRKIRPQYTEGPAVRVAGGRNQPEAEFIQALLLEEGIPSMLRRSRGFDVPDFMAAGPRDVLVPQSAEQAAHEVLLEAELVPQAAVRDEQDSPTFVLALVVGAVAVVALIAWLGTSVLG